MHASEIESPVAPTPERLPLEEFEREPHDCIERMLESGRPLALTSGDQATAVVLSADAYNALLIALDRAETLVGIQRGVEEMRRGEGIPLDEAFRQIREGERRRRTA